VPEERWHYRVIAEELRAKAAELARGVMGEMAARLMREGGPAGRPPEDRGRALFEAAKMVRRHGAALLREHPDAEQSIYEGTSEAGVALARRAMQHIGQCLADTSGDENATVLSASLVERGLYCDAAPALAWEAAKAMPNNSDETARMLCIGGSWLKNEDPQAADVFYKALVRRCRKTTIGAEADRLRWFPLLDEQGNLRPKPQQPLSPSERAARKASAALNPTNVVQQDGR
jgi:hypothetical protein